MKFKVSYNQEFEEKLELNIHSKDCPIIKDIDKLVSSYNKETIIEGQNEDTSKYLSLSEIECIFVLLNKTYVVDRKGNKYKINYRLYELEEILPSNFYKINKSCIANENYIDNYKVSFNGSIDCIFKSGHKDYVSRRCYQSIKRRYK